MAAAAENLLKKFRDDHSHAFKLLSATQFLNIWQHYDQDQNGYIEGAELEHFIMELTQSSGVIDKTLTPEALKKITAEFMSKYDTNKDNKIEIRELSHLLPIEENFLLLFRRETELASSLDFMKVWKNFDADGSGFIEKAELATFLDQLFKANKRNVAATNISEYTDVIMRLFDINGDGQLQISELTKLLPVKENLLQTKKLQNKITLKDLTTIFHHYDADNSGQIDGLELDGFLKDLFELTSQNYNVADLDTFKTAVMNACDENHDGNLSRDELTVVLLQFSNVNVEKKDAPAKK